MSVVLKIPQGSWAQGFSTADQYQVSEDERGGGTLCFLTLCLRKYPCCSKVVLFLRSCHRGGPCCDRSVEECAKRGVFTSATTKSKHDNHTIPKIYTCLISNDNIVS